MDKKSLYMIFGIIILGTSLLFYSTDHFQAFTAEQARRIDVLQQRPIVPNVMFEDSRGENFSLSDLRGKYVLATYIYTSCGDVCPLVETNFSKLYSSLQKDNLGEKLAFLSISFDPKRDVPHMLEHHRMMYQADGITWKMVRVPDQKELDLLLEKSGVIVIPIKNGFVHNAAFYLINPEGRLIRIFNYDSPDKVVEELKQIITF